MSEDERQHEVGAIAHLASLYSDEYLTSITDLQTSLEQAVGLRRRVALDRQTVKEMEIRAAAAALGGNEAARKAAALDKLAEMTSYAPIADRLQRNEHDLDVAEVQVTIATERCRLARANMEVSAAHLRALAIA